ncbi:HAMP domain-containing sensor histidine kinase [Candidatus Bariatricus faecipullorum]
MTVFTRNKMKSTYEEPMHRMAEATRKVADGDFSVFVPTVNTPDRPDYLDIMILDFNRMVEELGSVETMKTDFVSNVSHEMKTPVAVIRNYAELLQRESLGEEERKEYAKTVEEAAVRLSRLITNILKLNKLENQSISPETEVYDLCGQLENCILSFETQWEEKDLELEVDMEDRLTIKADRGLLELVWNNLLSNAVKYTEPGGTVSIRQQVSNGYVSVSVSDTGCGMSREVMEHIFDKFYQGDTSHSGEGNGLGLALVKRVVELMEGDISVTSGEGKGSTFTVNLPVLEDGKEEEENYGN